MNSSKMLLGLLCALPLFTTACSTEQAYLSGQGWRRNQCNQMTDAQDRARCIKEVDKPYDSYKQEVDTIKK
jgi:hypothetical protein